MQGGGPGVGGRGVRPPRPPPAQAGSYYQAAAPPGQEYWQQQQQQQQVPPPQAPQSMQYQSYPQQYQEPSYPGPSQYSAGQESGPRMMQQPAPNMYYPQQNQSGNFQQQFQGGPAADAFTKLMPNSIVRDAAQKIILDQMGSGSWSYMSLVMANMRYYFHVNNEYVLRKLQVIFVPCLHRKWSRERDPATTMTDEVTGITTGTFLPPSRDLNAPDLYIPLMSFITYILLMGFIMGIGKAFTPEVLGATATWAMMILFLEVVVLRAGLAIVGSSGTVVAPPLLDLVAYSSYKFVILVLDLIIWVLSSHNQTIYWVISSMTGISMTIFMARTLQRAFVTRVDTSGSFGMDTSHKSTRQYFLILVGICQIPLCLLLGRTVTRT